MMNKSLVKPSNYQNIKEILEITAQTTRKILKCDRVMVYDASNLPHAEVIAESVDAKSTSLLGTTIFDPFLTGDYLELYCYGRAVTIDDIDSTDIENSQLENLKQLNVKSLAIAPIAAGNELLGFLVAHQCSTAQPWHPQISSLLTEKANTASYALANIAQAQKQVNLAEPTVETQANGNISPMELPDNSNGNGNRNLLPTKLTKVDEKTKAFDRANEKISHELGRENILNRTVEEVRQLLECDRVVVYSLDENSYGVVVAESVAAGWTKALGQMIDDPCIADRYINEYRNGRVRVINDINGGKVTPCYREQLEDLEVKANLVASIVSDGELFGLLIAHQCSSTRNWQDREINWITEIATQVGLLLEHTKVFAETQSQQQQMLSDQ